jgi:hypothetical protein
VIAWSQRELLPARKENTSSERETLAADTRNHEHHRPHRTRQRNQNPTASSNSMTIHDPTTPKKEK